MKSKLLLVLLGLVLGVGAVRLFNGSPTKVAAQNMKPGTNSAPATSPRTNSGTITNIAAATNKPVAVSTNSPSTNQVTATTNQVAAASTNKAPTVATNLTTQTNAAPAEAEKGSPDEIQLSFQGANVDMIVQWLAKTTGKSVVKHPKVQCQLTIVSSKKLPPREALNLVYRALALEGFNVIEMPKSIVIIPEGQDPKMLPEIADTSKSDPSEGRQKVIKIFSVKNITPTELKDKIKSVLSEKAIIETSDRSNQLIITDYNDNIRLAGEPIKELDVPSNSDVVIEFFDLKYSDAEEIGNLISIVINAQPAPPPSQSGGGGQPMMGGPRPTGMPPQPMPQPMPQPPGGPQGPSTAASGGVKIWPDKNSNRLIVAAPKSKLPEIKKLLDLLDTDKQPDISVRVIPLKNITAEDLMREIAPLYQKTANKTAKDSVEVSANLRSNSLIILSSESRFKEIQRLVTALDTEEATEKVMQAFALKNADAEDVAKQLQDLNQDQDSQNRYPFFIIYGSSQNRGGKKINVVADKRRNTVMVQAPPASMEGIGKMIATLDEPVADNALAPKIYRLKFVSAVDIEDVLNELFTKKPQQQRLYWDPYSSFNNSDDRDGKGGRLYGKIRITSEPYSNSIIISGNSPENLTAVEDVLKELDSPSQAGDTTLRVTLKFAKATTVANNINILFAKGGSPMLRQQPQQPDPNIPRQPNQPFNNTQSNFALEQDVKDEGYFPWLGGPQDASGRGPDGRNASARPVSDLVGRVRVVSDKRSNSLLITSNLHFFPQVIKLIEDMDAPTAQVLIEANIIEVSSDFRDRLGVRWSPDGSRAFDSEDLDNSFRVKTGASYQDVFAGSKLANSLHSGVLDSSINVDFLIQFLKKNSEARVLAQPQINIADNETGKLFVGAQVPFISGSLNTDIGGRNDTFQYRDVGIILEVTPHINNEEDVALRIHAESSNIRNGETLFGGAILDTRNFRTDLMVKSGQTLVLGGIIQREESSTERKVPGLGSIPGLGWAFKKRDKTSREVELMVFLRPRVTRSPEQAQDLLHEVEQKVPLIKDWEQDSLERKQRQTEPERKKK